ncbi:helix-turn-helix transcriptional regulator [Phytoactinopolyspora limicola]|uniref:helix-turn-helix transcriptional regulator n=1 Tax=Phytoactinopolyspora limicola TaxID=2715536 RepID=UPI00140B241C|nr:AAA family ATPase [Phytoactinopolyspora limicola]
MRHTTCTAPVVRAAVLSDLHTAFETLGRVVCTGPAGIGKTVLLDQLLRALPETQVLRAYPRGEPEAYSTLAELLDGLPPACVAELPGPRRAALASVLRWDQADDTPDPTALRLAVRDVLARLAGPDPVLLAVDSIDDADDASLDLLGHVLRHVPADRLHLLATARSPGFAHRLDLSGDHDAPIPAWTMAEVAELLAPLRLPGQVVLQVHRRSGGSPDLAARIGAAAGSAFHDAASMPALPPPAAALTREHLSALSARSRETLLFAALAVKPSPPLLQRAGRHSAMEDLLEAAVLGLIRQNTTGEIQFTADATVEALITDTPTPECQRAHELLAEAETDPVVALRHRANAARSPAPELLTELDAACATAAQRGSALLAAELALLAADHTPHSDHDALIERLVQATQHASWAGRYGLVQRAAHKVLSMATDPSHRLRTFLAVINSVGQGFTKVHDVFTEAAAEDGVDPFLKAQLTLWRAWRANVSDGDLQATLDLAGQAVQHAREGADTFTEMQAYALMARILRYLGRDGVEDALIRAESLETTPDVEIPASPRFARARDALFDDRLDAARQQFGALLPMARRNGDVKSLLEVLRNLAEVEVRAGRCAMAREHRDEFLTKLAGSDLSPGPSWYSAGLVECDAGDIDRALGFATQGLHTAREDNDVIFTARNLYVLGRARLLKGDVDEAVRCLREAERLELASGTIDPSVLPWPSELAEALAASGEVDAAQELVATTRKTAISLGRDNVLPRLDLAEAACRIAIHEHDGALDLLQQAADGFEERGLAIEHGRALLTTAGVYRRLRRRSTARELLNQAEQVFTGCDARPWLLLVAAETRRLGFGFDAGSAGGPAAPGAGSRHPELSPSEARLAELIRDGASNRQAASSLGVSVKTVEGTLTRIYRKLGIRSRAQLSRYLP